ncbi:MAG: hypothetical protein ACJAVR_000956 [Paracoccaceae bacterium]
MNKVRAVLGAREKITADAITTMKLLILGLDVLRPAVVANDAKPRAAKARFCKSKAGAQSLR